MNCVVCFAKLPDAIAVIGEQYPSAVFLSGRTESELGLEKTALDLTLCDNEECRLVQLVKPVNLEMVYKNYPYQTGTTATMKEILDSVVSDVLENVSLQPGDVVLDIGGNDGTLLSLIDKVGIFKVNIDPASDIEQLDQGEGYLYLNEMFSHVVYKQTLLPPPKIIFSTAMFYQLIDPKGFVKEVEKVMGSDSIFCLQFSYLGSMYKNNVFDNIVHEHITYFSLFSLENLLVDTGLRIVGAKVVDTYGGSLRVFISKADSYSNFSKFKFQIEDIRNQEIDLGTNSAEELRRFGNRFCRWKIEMRELLDTVTKEVGAVEAVGASTKGNMILQAIGITTTEISCIHDNNDKKIGTKTTGTNIPIVKENLKHSSGKYFFLLPYYYFNFFELLFQSSLERDEKVNLIVPLPNPRIIRIEGKK
jgi:NDP-4-keto-2,6-dideoxyhexose 3-C-methyltransferase